MRIFKRILPILPILPILTATHADIGRLITQGGSAYSITTPFDRDDLFEIQYVQSADVMYLVHNDYPPQILRRYGETNWTIEDVNITGGPFMMMNIEDANTITPDANEGDITLTANFDVFLPGHVGAWWQLSHIVDPNSLSGRFDQTYPTDQTSPIVPILLGQEYTVTTEGEWWGVVIIQRSYDDRATWEEVHSFSSFFSGNMLYSGIEEYDDADYRLYFATLHVYPGSSGKYYCQYNFSPISFLKNGIVKITGVSDARTASATVYTKLGGITATYRWAEGAFSEYRGYPAAVSFYQERLCFGGTVYEPQTIWLSQTDDWHNFLVTEYDTSSMAFTIASDQVENIRWLLGEKKLLIGTNGGEWTLGPPSGKIFTPANYYVERQSTYGSARIQAVGLADSVVFAQRQAKKIRQMRYDLNSNGMRSPDISILAEHLFAEGIKEMAFQKAPHTLLWVVTNDGNLETLTLEESQDVIGWSMQTFDGDCESVAVIPGEGEDEIWIVVERTIEGTDVHYIEQFQPFDWGDDEDIFFVDCGLSWEGAASVAVDNVTRADPAIVTATGHAFTDGDQIRFSDIEGMTEIDYRVFSVGPVSGGTFELRDRLDTVDIDSTGFTAFTNGGTVEQVSRSFSGLDHLEGETIVATGDSGYAGTATVASGVITLDDYYHRIHAGLSYTSKIQPMRLEFTETGGQLQGMRKRVTAVTVDLYQSLGGDVGPNFTDYDTLVFREADDLLENAPPFFDGYKRILFPSGWQTEGDIAIRHALPLPLTLRSLIVEYEANP